MSVKLGAGALGGGLSAERGATTTGFGILVALALSDECLKREIVRECPVVFIVFVVFTRGSGATTMGGFRAGRGLFAEDGGARRQILTCPFASLTSLKDE